MITVKVKNRFQGSTEGYLLVNSCQTVGQQQLTVNGEDLCEVNFHASQQIQNRIVSTCFVLFDILNLLVKQFVFKSFYTNVTFCRCNLSHLKKKTRKIKLQTFPVIR